MISTPKKIDILQEFEQNNPAKILLISKFETPQSKEKYLFVTLASKGDRDLIIGKGSINLFQSNFPVHQTRPKKQNTNFGPHQAPRSSFTPSAQRLGQALSSASNWGGYRHTQPNHHSRNQHSHYSSAFGTSDFEIKIITETTSKICEVLSYGMENPKAYVLLVNQSFAHRDLPHIYIYT